MRIVEKTNWSGIGYVIPRSQLKEFTQRPEAGRPGVYVLTGPDPEDGGADLASHRRGRSPRPAPGAAPGQGVLDHRLRLHLQGRLPEQGPRPAPGGPADSAWPQAAAKRCSGFRRVVLCCPARLSAFEQPPTWPPQIPDPLGARAGRGYESPNGFTVLKGARGRRDFTASSPDALIRTREQLIRQGVLARQDNQVELLQDYEFKSPSQAAGLLLARSANGRLDWKDAAGHHPQGTPGAGGGGGLASW